jgi:hypothetical protein
MPGETSPSSGAQAAPGEGETEPQAGEGTTPQAGTTPAAQAATGDNEPETISLEEARKLRRENRSLRERLTPLEQAEEARKQAALAELPELERAKRENAELKEQLASAATRDQERNIRVAALEAATTLGFRNPALAYKLIERDLVQYAEDGTPKNVDALLKKIAEGDPYLTRSGGADFGGGHRGETPGQGTDMNALLRAAGRPK